LSRQTTLYTFGHGTLDAGAFVALLREVGIATVVDVRTVPKSRHNPQFVRETMAGWLGQAGVAYEWKPELGGFRRPLPDSRNCALRNPSFRGYADYMSTEPFANARHELLVRAARERLAIVCSESLWWRCHRRLIADSAVLISGWNVEHLMHDGRLQSHRPTDGVRREGGQLVYDGGQMPLGLTE
jgi:uncharacterized protein (DUF488 family)